MGRRSYPISHPCQHKARLDTFLLCSIRSQTLVSANSVSIFQNVFWVEISDMKNVSLPCDRDCYSDFNRHRCGSCFSPRSRWYTVDAVVQKG